MSMNRKMIIAAFLVFAACGGSGETTGSGASSADAPAATGGTSTEAEATTTTVAATTSSSVAAVAPGVAALSSGRGDDGSLEVGVWFASDPFATGDVRLLIGTDADDSYPGTGDPRTHIDGWVEITEEIGLFDAGSMVATGEDVSSLFSWTGPNRQAWFYFIGNVPTRAGTVWVVVEVDGALVTGGVAGAPFDVACSYQSAGVDFGPVPSDLPDYGTPCRYPLG
jgi:hypothetical protein